MTFTQTYAITAPLPCTATPDDWFAEHDMRLQAAKRACSPCALRDACLHGALERREPYGVWGGEILVAGSVTGVKRGRGRPRRATS